MISQVKTRGSLLLTSITFLVFYFLAYFWLKTKFSEVLTYDLIVVLIYLFVWFSSTSIMCWFITLRVKKHNVLNYLGFASTAFVTFSVYAIYAQTVVNMTFTDLQLIAAATGIPFITNVIGFFQELQFSGDILYSDVGYFIFLILMTLPLAILMVLVSFLFSLILLSIHRFFDDNDADNSSDNKETTKTFDHPFFRVFIGLLITTIIPILVILDFDVAVGSAKQIEFNEWVKYASTSPHWVLFNIFTLFSFLVLTPLKKQPDPSSIVLGVTGKKTPMDSIKGYYQEFADDDNLKAHKFEVWMNKNKSIEPSEQSSNIRKDINALVEGEALIRHGNADFYTYHMLLETTFKIQDRGELTLIICPDFSSERVDLFMDVGLVSTLPETIRNSCRITHDKGIDGNFSGNRIYDLIVIEESQVSPFFAMEREQLKNVIPRVSMIAFIDFHQLDASALYLTFSKFDFSNLPGKTGLFFQSLPRHNISNQISRMESLLKRTQNNKASEIEFDWKPVGYLFWMASSALRSALMERVGLTPESASYRTSAYLALCKLDGEQRQLPSTQPNSSLMKSIPSPRFEPAVLIPKNIEADFEDLKKELDKNGLLTNDNKILKWSLERWSYSNYPIYAPFEEARMLTIVDVGSVIDAINVSPNFWHEAPDFLCNIIMPGYLGRKFLCDQVKVAIGQDDLDMEKLKDWIPIAQVPGLGLPEIGQILYEKLSNRSYVFTETEANHIFENIDGIIEKYLNIFPSASGITELLSLISEDFTQNVIMKLDQTGRQNEQYSLIGSLQKMNTGSAVKIKFANQAAYDMELAYNDFGLIFHESAYVRLKNAYISIETVNHNSKTISGSTKVARNTGNFATPEPVYHYSRHYKILISKKDDQANGFAVFRNGNNSNYLQNGVLKYVYLQANIERISGGFTERSSDLEPTPSDFLKNQLINSFSSPRSFVRNFRNILIFNIPLAEEQRDQEDIYIAMRSLAASLQVVMAISFPALAQRIAVVPIIDGDTNQRDINANSLKTIFPTGEFLGGDFSDIDKKIHDVETSGSEFEYVNNTSRYSIAIIEDGESDLGVCRAIEGSMNVIIDRWQKFLAWAEDDDDWNVSGEIDIKIANLVAPMKSESS